MASKAVYWILTIPHHLYVPYLHPGVKYVRGQLERGGDTGYLHWQLSVVLSKQQRLTFVKKLFGNECHAEPSKSAAVDEYVWKEDTRVEGTQFELGTKPLRRNRSADWDAVVDAAKRSKLDDIPADILVRCYNNLKRIAADYMEPVAIERKVFVFWGPTGTGKSRRAWDEAGLDAYPKDPRSKFWDGYRGQRHVIIDEFRGAIDISHILRWCDRYPVIVEVKGTSTVLKAETIWFTSNLHPKDWYSTIDYATRDALLRRFEVIEIN